MVIHRLEDGAIRTKTLTVEVTVRDKEAVFPVTDRWVVGAVAGDTVPAGTVVNTIEEGIAAIRSNNGGWLQIRGGKTYSLTSISDPRSGEGDVRIDTWGGRATLDTSQSAFLNMSSEEQPLTLTVKGLDFQGSYDASTGLHNGSNNLSLIHI